MHQSAVGAAVLAAPPGVVAQPGRPPGPAARARMKVGLYSITFLGVWYRGEALPLEQVVRRAKQFGYDGMEIDGKRPHGNPLDWPKQRCQELRAMATGEGIDIYSVAANNDFSSPIPEHREAQITYVRDLILMAADLGVKTCGCSWAGPALQAPAVGQLRHRPGYLEGSPREILRGRDLGVVPGRARRGHEVRRPERHHAGPPGPPAGHQGPQDVLRMVREINSPNLKVCLDVSMMPDQRPEVVRQACRDVGALQVLSHFGGEYDQLADGTIPGADYYPVFVEGMREIGYAGYIGYELCHPLPVVNGQKVGLDFAENMPGWPAATCGD